VTIHRREADPREGLYRRVRMLDMIPPDREGSHDDANARRGFNH
jgi:hypothetical protein